MRDRRHVVVTRVHVVTSAGVVVVTRVLVLTRAAAATGDCRRHGSPTSRHLAAATRGPATTGAGVVTRARVMSRSRVVDRALVVSGAGPRLAVVCVAGGGLVGGSDGGHRSGAQRCSAGVLGEGPAGGAGRSRSTPEWVVMLEGGSTRVCGAVSTLSARACCEPGAVAALVLLDGPIQ